MLFRSCDRHRGSERISGPVELVHLCTGAEVLDSVDLVSLLYICISFFGERYEDEPVKERWVVSHKIQNKDDGGVFW